MSKAVLNVVLGADHKLILTESLSHVAAALIISVPGVNNLQSKLCAVLKHMSPPMHPQARTLPHLL
jgi:hypothetical protein